MKTFRLLTGVILLTGCTSAPEPPSATPGLRALGQPVVVAPAYSDEAIGREIRRQLDVTNAGELAGVIIQVDGGKIVLRGTVRDDAAAWRAAGIARAVTGVQEVRDEIQRTIRARN